MEANKSEEKYYIKKVFLISLAMACLLLLPFVIAGGGTFYYYGDYNLQQIPFYRECISSIRSGNIGWNWYTDLGANFIGSYSFYTLGSPFFWLAVLFPASLSQYLLAPLLALKIACSSLTAYLYIRRFTSKPDSALIGALLYAFSGFSMYSLFFNHFQEVIVFFPLLLTALEEAVLKKRRGFFAVMLAISALVNYFFFFGECVFLIIYFIVRMISDTAFRLKFRDFLLLALESVLGAAIAGVLLLPSILAVVDIPRVASILHDWNFMFYSPANRYGSILESIFFPPEIPLCSFMFDDSGATAANVALYLPLFSAAGVIALLKEKKRHWVKTILLICIVIMLVPVFNSAFTLFNSEYYARWFYMPMLMCCLATVYALEHSETDMKFGVKFCAIVASILAAFTLLSPFEKKEFSLTDNLLNSGISTKTTRLLPRFMVEKPDIRLLASIIICAVSLITLALILRYRRKVTEKLWLKRLVPLTAVFGLVLGYYFLISGVTLSTGSKSQKQFLQADIELDNDEFCRAEMAGRIHNAAMMLNQGSLKSFVSIVPGSVFELYDTLQTRRDQASEPDTSLYALRALTGVKYFLIPSEANTNEYEYRLPKTYEYRETQDGYDIYTTPYALPMGFAYDNYIPKNTLVQTTDVDNLMINAVILTQEQINRYADILAPLSDSEIQNISDDSFAEDTLRRIADGVADFEITKKGFNAETNYESEKLVMFSVPYDKGWSATIDGKPVEADKVNGGFLALRVGAGVKKIVCTYHTPGLKVGIIMTISGILLLAGYLVLCKTAGQKKHS